MLIFINLIYYRLYPYLSHALIDTMHITDVDYILITSQIVRLKIMKQKSMKMVMVLTMKLVDVVVVVVVVVQLVVVVVQLVVVDVVQIKELNMVLVVVMRPVGAMGPVLAMVHCLE